MEKLYELVYGKYFNGIGESANYTTLARASTKDALVKIAAQYGLRPYTGEDVYGTTVFIQEVPMVDDIKLRDAAHEIRVQAERQLKTFGISLETKYLIDPPQLSPEEAAEHEAALDDFFAGLFKELKGACSVDDILDDED